MTLYGLLKLAHVLSMSIWMGASILTPFDVRQSLHAGPPHSLALMSRLRRTALLMNRAALATIMSGVGLMWMLGAAAVTRRLCIALALTLLCIGVGKWLIRPVITELSARVHAPLPPEDVERLARRFSFAVHTEHALRIAVLILMISPFL